MLMKQHFEQAAKMVNAIRCGGWTFDTPAWAGPTIQPDDDDIDYAYTRAVWTAEAFAMLFQSANPRFDETRFLRACGLLADVKWRT